MKKEINNSKYINEVLNSEEYKNNELQINTIKDVLINHSDIPEQLISWLITAVENNTRLICEAEYKSKK